jgi:hypothetical protein
MDALAALSGAFPAQSKDDLVAVCNWLQPSTFDPHFDKKGPLLVGEESVQVLTRTYFNASDSPNTNSDSCYDSRFRIFDARASLTAARPSQREMYACIQSRDGSGFHRMEYAGLVLMGNHPWSIPYLLQLATDYVTPIAERLYVRLPTLTQARMGQIALCAADNPEWIKTLSHRVVANWDLQRYCWYREECGVVLYKNLSDYPAYRTLVELGLWPKTTAHRRLRAEFSNTVT